jgi:hypothetical protein
MIHFSPALLSVHQIDKLFGMRVTDHIDVFNLCRAGCEVFTEMRIQFRWWSVGLLQCVAFLFPVPSILELKMAVPCSPETLA